MISFLWRKMWKNKWMMACLFIGNLLLIGIVSATPLYINATMTRILQQNMRTYQLENNVYPALVSLQFVFNSVPRDERIQTYLDAMNDYSPGMIEALSIPALRTVRQDTLAGWHLLPYVPRSPNPRPRITNVTGITDMESNVTITHGRLPSQVLVEGNIIEAIATEQAMLRNNMVLNELMHVNNVRMNEDGTPTYFVKIVGIYELAEGSEPFWSISQMEHHLSRILIPDDLILRHFVYNYHTDYRITTNWFHLLDYRAMTSRGVPHYLTTLDDLQGRFNSEDSHQAISFSENFSEISMYHIHRAAPLAVTLWVLQVPIYVLLAFYIYMVSRQILQLEQNEISVLKSRGASRGQILGLYAMQGLFIGAVCYPLGLLLGVQICRLLGASNGFLNLVQRTAISVEITPEALIYAVFAVFLSFLTMFLPVIRFSKVGIVDHKRNRSGKVKKPLWQRFFLDILCLGVSLYVLRNFYSQQEAMAMVIRDSQAVDPLLFLSSSLFIIGLGLLCLRLFPYFVALVFRVGKRFWPPAAYASFIKVIRSAGEEQFIMIFLLFTLSIGTFSSQAARTINLNSDHQIKYLAGADLTFSEIWRTINREAAMSTSQQYFFIEPDFERFTQFEEVDAITRVQIENVHVRASGATDDISMNDVELMAIETDSFGHTIWFRNDLLRTHINYFLNVLASRPDGVLLSDNFRTINGLAIGDSIDFTDRFGIVTHGIIMGFVEHWPSFAPMQRVEVDYQVLEVQNSLIIANLGYIQSQWNIRPYQVWMRTNTETNRFFYEFAAENRLRIPEFTDAKAEVVASRSDPILQGTNGVLTVGFIVTLLICFTGFLIYWILSIRSRVLQFGIFRAMGMGMRNLVGLLINEQCFITLTAIGLGALVGEISARLFVPLIQMSYSAADQVIPLLIVTETRDYVNLYAVVGVIIVICLVVLGGYISKIKIAQALKLGED